MIEYLDTALQLSYSIAPALIAGGLALTSAAATSAATGKMNRKSMRFQEKMFDKTNEYNSPVEQRKRLQKAGLNPNLVYGGSPGGTAGTATQPAKPDFNTPDYTAIGQQASEGVMNYYNAKSIQAGIDVNEQRAENIKQDTLNKSIDSIGKTIKNSQNALDYKTKRRLFQNTVRTAEERLNNIQANTEYTTGKNAREDRIIGETQQKLKAEISNLKKQGKKLDAETIMKRIDARLFKEYNIRPNDPFYFRAIEGVMRGLDNLQQNIFDSEPLKNKFK